MNLKKTWPILKRTFTAFGEDNVLRHSAALAYYAIFSIGPLLVIVVGFAGLAFQRESVHHEIHDQLASMLGQNSAKTLDSIMSAQKHGTSVLATMVGLVALLIGAGGVFGQLQDSLNSIWEVKSKPGKSIWAFVRNRFLSFTMVLGTGFLLLISMALTTFLTSMTGSLGNKLALSEALAHALNFIVSFAAITLLFEMIFKCLPDVRVPAGKVWPGAIVTAFLFTIGKYLLALYLGRESTASPFGAASSVVIILMWIYYASVILLVGAEFTRAYAVETGTKVQAAKFAVLAAKRRAEEGSPQNQEAHHKRAHFGRGIQYQP